MQKCFISLFLIFFTYSVQGQEFSAGPLKPRSVQHLKQLVARLDTARSDTSAYWEYLRPVSPKGFKEGVILFSINGKPRPAITEFRVKILAKKDRIFYYQVDGEQCTGSVDEEVCTFNPLENYREEKQWLQMQKAFKNFFGPALDTTELFLKDFPFGYRCDLVGSYTPGKEFTDSMIRQQNKIAINQWLRSPNTEKQLFAAFALRKLKQQGLPLNRQERKQIRFVLKKRGTIYFCSYCIYGEESSRKITRFYRKSFKNQPESETTE